MTRRRKLTMNLTWPTPRRARPIELVTCQVLENPFAMPLGKDTSQR